MVRVFGILLLVVVFTCLTALIPTYVCHWIWDLPKTNSMPIFCILIAPCFLLIFGLAKAAAMADASLDRYFFR